MTLDQNAPRLCWLVCDAKQPGETGLDALGGDKSTNGRDDDGNGLIDDWSGWDFIDDDNDPQDTKWHGTHIAGTIAASTNNRIGVAGITWNTKIVPIRVIGPNKSVKMDAAIAAVGYSTSLGIPIVNLSWGGGGRHTVLVKTMEHAEKNGTFFVIAAGNDARNNDRYGFYPANFEGDHIISVTATTENDSLASFSNYGLKSTDVSAPGRQIMSTAGGAYITMSGTSMAAPHVSGVAALMLAQNPLLTPAELKEHIINSADPIGALSGKSVSGGRLNAAAALKISN